MCNKLPVEANAAILRSLLNSQGLPHIGSQPGYMLEPPGQILKNNEAQVLSQINSSRIFECGV